MFYNVMDPMKSDFIIKRNKKGKSESTLIKGEREKEKEKEKEKGFKPIIHFSHLSWRALKKSWGFQEKP